MEQQIERILELVDVVYHKSSGESMSEIWGILYEAYCHTKDKRVKERYWNTGIRRREIPCREENGMGRSG